MDPSTRKRVIVTAAMQVALKRGLAAITFEDVADACEVETSYGTVRRYSGTLTELQTEVARFVQQLPNREPEHMKILEDAKRFAFL